MNKKMKMFIICAIFALIVSCKNYASGEDVKKSLEQDLKGKVKGFLDTKKEEFFGDFKKPEAKVQPKDEESMQADEPQEQDEDQVVQGVAEDQKLKEEIEQKIKELKDKIEKSDPKSVSLKTYSDYEKEIEELKEKLKDKEKFEKELEILEKALNEKIEKRKKELEESQKKFEELKGQVESAIGITDGERAKNQGKVGIEALRHARGLGFKNISSGNSTSDIAKEIIVSSLKKIEEELEELKKLEKESKDYNKKE
ncbi:hypothetical protein [Borreliella burgdorferi]|uniref:hypothetical protein n=1 Tax=Borreliella burgdorferi TaxID=139 RepID=UPI00017F3B40|nr:hypothetical protein [Borreliella burgdorferi]ACN56035.1 ErpK protein [Borreliella burgdorferi CA-11.2A]ACN56276.1 ErpK protein [Borreliella burgdorferi CA-11.2A]MCD2375632.1 hypothetical protein [Borreliella burgdorferi]MCD2387628.1 hypothetical protein [Borreliella burgdorferi]MCD2391248.1 hypothetical protein [Borreliella burgdorferi]